MPFQIKFIWNQRSRVYSGMPYWTQIGDDGVTIYGMLSVLQRLGVAYRF